MSNLYMRMKSDSQRNGTKARTLGGYHIAEASLDGWRVGVDVNLSVNDRGKVIITLWRTGGTNGGKNPEFIAQIKEGEPTVYLEEISDE